MSKKRRTTKEDEKGDAFERLYAFLISSNKNLQPIEKSHLDVVEKNIVLPTQEEIAKEKAKEKAEFDKLYTQLSSLSSRGSAETVCAPSNSNDESVAIISDTLENEYPLLTREISIPNTPLVKVSLEKSEEPSLENISNEFDEVYEQIIRIITMKSQMVQTITPVLKPTSKVKSKIKVTPQCIACCKIFSTKGSLIRHQQTTISCQKWLALPVEQQIPMIDKPIHMISDDYLKQSITGDNQFQCRFCSITFTNRGNHHKHYQSAHTCNRMAYIEYKRLVAQ